MKRIVCKRLYRSPVIRKPLNSLWRKPRFFNKDDYSDNVVKLIIGTNVAVFLGWQYARAKSQSKGDRSTEIWMYKNFSSSYSNLADYRVWTLVTNSFSHTDIIHLGINMFVLHSFGPALIASIGAREFTRLYFSSAIGSSLASIAYQKSTVSYDFLGRPTNSRFSIGASGSISGITCCYAAMHPFAQVYFFGLVPMPIWAATAGFIAYDAYRGFSRTSGIVDSAGHLGGAATGILWYFARIR